jgi:hypothetical protein
MDDSMFAAYRADADGQMHLSYRFRSTRGYNFRNSTAGAIFYWLLDHSAVVRILNRPQECRTACGICAGAAAYG